jgi:hypothetical protein
MQLSVRPKWEEIEKARGKCGAFFCAQGLSNDSVHMLTMVISELIENGIKYGNFSPPGKKVEVSICIANRTLTVEVLNPVDDRAQDHLRRLDRTIQWIRGYQDPFEAYVERLKEVSKKPLTDDESGLGLVRIAYEGKAILDFFVQDNSVLNVSAVSNLGRDSWR